MRSSSGSGSGFASEKRNEWEGMGVFGFMGYSSLDLDRYSNIRTGQVIIITFRMDYSSSHRF